MEQEETKTTAAAGVEMPPAAESWVQLHESELTELTTTAGFNQNSIR